MVCAACVLCKCESDGYCCTIVSSVGVFFTSCSWQRDFIWFVVCEMVRFRRHLFDGEGGSAKTTSAHFAVKFFAIGHRTYNTQPQQSRSVLAFSKSFAAPHFSASVAFVFVANILCVFEALAKLLAGISAQNINSSSKGCLPLQCHRSMLWKKTIVLFTCDFWVISKLSVPIFMSTADHADC